MRCDLGEKRIVGAAEDKEPLIREKGERGRRAGEGGQREREPTKCRTLHKKNTSPKPLVEKMRGANHCKFLQAAELKD